MNKIYSVRHAYPEKAGFVINRINGHKKITLLHFHNPVILMSEGKTITTQKNACIIYSANSQQYFKSQVPLVHDWIHFENLNPEFFNKHLVFNKVFYPDNPERITVITRELEKEFYSNKAFKEVLIDAKVNELMIALCRKSEGNAIHGQTYQKLLSLRNYIFSNLEKNITVEGLAKQINLSSPRLFALYSKVFGASPIADLINARIERAKLMLVQGDESINTLSILLGYNNVYHFIRQFKKLVGVSPGEYRKTFK